MLRLYCCSLEGSKAAEDKSSLIHPKIYPQFIHQKEKCKIATLIDIIFIHQMGRK